MRQKYSALGIFYKRAHCGASVSGPSSTADSIDILQHIFGEDPKGLFMIALSIFVVVTHTFYLLVIFTNFPTR
jgi:hypothetical protein